MRKLIGIVGTIIGIIGFALGVISVFVSDDSIQKILVSVAITLIIFDVVVLGICARIIQTKDAVSVAKNIYKELKNDSSDEGKDNDNFIDPVSCGLKGNQRSSVRDFTRISNANNSTNDHAVLKVFNLIFLILFLLVLVATVILFIIGQNIAGAITVGCGLAGIIIMGIVNSIAQNTSKPRKVNLTEEQINEVTARLRNREVPVQLVRASVNDAEVIWEMQKTAFAELLAKYGDYNTSPANETLSKVTSRFEDPYTYHYFIRAEEQTVGVIRVVDTKTKEKKRLAQIFIMPEYRLKGYARSAIKAVEKIHGSTGWELDTILQERHLVSLYMRLGYRIKKETKRITSNMILVVLEK